MFKTIVTALVVLAICLLVMDRCSRASEAEIDKIIENQAVVTGKLLEQIKGGQERYRLATVEADGLAKEIKALLDRPAKVIVKNLPGETEIMLVPRETFPGLAVAIDQLISEMYVLRSEHDGIVSGLNAVIDVKDRTIIMMRSAMRKRWGFTVGPFAGIGPDGKAKFGIGASWGLRL